MAKDSSITEKLSQYLDGLETLPKTFNKGQVTKGLVVKVREGEVLVNIGGRAEGVISGRELSLYGKREKLEEGDEILVYVLNPETDKGQVHLSIRKTGEARKWQQLDEVLDNGKGLDVKVIEANNGGVIVSIDDIDENFRGFIPTSQLDNDRIYPLSGFSDKKEASRELQKKLAGLIGEKITAKVIEINRKKNRVILSEKLVKAEVDLDKRKKTLKDCKVGDTIEGEVTGIAPFGLFVNAQGLEGLVHLSEISWDKVENPADFYKVGDTVKVQIIGIEDDGRRIAYSIKRILPDPWNKIIKKYKVGQKVKGIVQKVVNYGAFVRIDGEVNGLIHISELSDGLVTDPSKFVEVGKEYNLVIISISDSERHLGLSLKRAQDRVEVEKESAAKIESAEELRSLENLS
ncbi:MAG: S1 RNA-binding domain-containing protein [Candidatus Dojkabacteria bacterium]|jgi:small subunit ribosomal protein S1|nr:S1 RNA-binding domain-containing protein [Candidatus Dojkabacteria bacterium]